MCEACLEKAMEINPDLIRVMKAVEPEYRELENKLREQFKAITKTEVVDETDTLIDVPQEHQEQFQREQDKLMGILGMAAALGWFTALECDSKQDTQMHAHPLMSMLQEQINNGDAYRYLARQQRH